MSLYHEPYSSSIISLRAPVVKDGRPKYNRNKGPEMIRKRTANGFLRPLRGPLAGALLFSSLAAAPILPGQAPYSPWWEIRLTVELKGDYALKCEGQPVSGEFAGRLRWEGRLEPDGDDFLLIEIKTEALEWRLREKSGPDGGQSVLDAPEVVRPTLRLNYVLREGDDIELDFEVGGTPIPLHPHPLALPLELARSSSGGGGRPDYSDFIRSGSNRIVLPATDLKRRRPERAFAWEWGRVERIDRDARTYVSIQSHSVEAVVAFVRH